MLRLKRLIIIAMVLTCMTLVLPSFVSTTTQAKKFMHLNYINYRLPGDATVKLKIMHKSKNRRVKWSSSKKSIARVSKSGVVKGIRKGKCTITGKVGKKKYKCKITVLGDSYLTRLNYKKKLMNVNFLRINLHPIKRQNSVPIIDTAKNSTFALHVLNNKKKVKWYSTNKNIVSVNNSGVVTARHIGSTKIVAKVDKKSITCSVAVNNLKQPIDVFEQESVYKMLNAVNRSRAKRNIKPLSLRDDLVMLANVRAGEITCKNWKFSEGRKYAYSDDKCFSHQRPNGLSFASVYDEYHVKKGQSVGENCAFAIRDVREMYLFPGDIFTELEKSSLHNNNMLSPAYDDIGIGFNSGLVWKDDYNIWRMAAFCSQEFSARP